MATIDKEFADNLARHQGYFNGDDVQSPDNPRCVLIIEYDNAWGGKGYGCVFEGERNRYTPSEYVRNPIVYWEYKS